MPATFIDVFFWRANGGQNFNIHIASKSFENMAQFRLLETTVTNQNVIQEEIERTLNSGNAYYHSF
jgi:hypothetical protein